jgi:hypothetical protein
MLGISIGEKHALDKLASILRPSSAIVLNIRLKGAA